MRASLALIALALAACATTPRAYESPISGSYRLTGVNDRSVPAESPTEPGVVMEAGTLALEPGGSYVLQMSARAGAQPAAATATVRGTYHLAGEMLSFTPDASSAGAAVQFRVLREAAGLRLVDEHSNAFVFARQ